MYAIYGNIYHQYTPNVSIYTYIYIYQHHGSYGYDIWETIMTSPSDVTGVMISRGNYPKMS